MDVDGTHVAEESSGYVNNTSNSSISPEDGEEPMEIEDALVEQPGKSKMSLLQSVLDSNLKHEDLARDLIEQYMEDPNAALVSILQLVLEGSGCQYQIPKSTARPFVYRDILGASTEKFCAVSHYYPMIMKNSAQKFERKVGDFFQCLLKLAHGSSIISDDVFLFEVSGFIMACSESNMRPIRHTSTMIGLKMLTALNELPTVAKEDGSLKRLWLRMFDCLFVARHLDVVTGIRLLCVTELGHWIRKYPEGNLQPKSLRYFYEGLNDSFGDVRKCCLEVLTDLAAGDEELRTMRVELAMEFRHLIVLTCVERECELGEAALRLLTSFYRSSPTILSNVDCLLLDQLLLASNRGLAQAAAGLFTLRWMVPQRGASPSQIIYRLLDFFIRYVKHEHAAYLVDALIDSCELVLDWESMVDMLMEDPAVSRLGPKERTALIEILCRGVKQTITGEIPPGRYTKDLVRTPKPAAQLRATQILAPILSQLLLMHLSNPVDLENLLELPQHFYLNYYRKSANAEQLELLLKQIRVIMLKQYPSLVLRMASLTLMHLNNIPSTKRHIEELFHTAVFSYKMALRTWQLMYGTPSSPSPARTSRSLSRASSGASSRASSGASSRASSAARPRSRSRGLLESLRLISALYSCFDLSQFNLTESVLSSLKRVCRNQDQRPSSDDLPVEATNQYMKVCFYSLNWDLRCVMREDENRSDLELEESCAALKKHLEDYLSVALHIVATGDADLGFDSFSAICDLYIVFGDPLIQHPRSFVRAIRYAPSLREFELLETFVLNHLFKGGQPQDLSKETMFDELQRRRDILVSYCKLLALNVFPSMRACKILQYYDKYHAAYGDIMRSAMERAMDINPVNYGMTMLHTCLNPFKQLMTDVNNDGVRAMSTLEFHQLLNLARRLGENYNTDLLQNRHSVNALHRAGILYVMESMSHDAETAAPKNLLFLRVLKEFVPQLLNQDRVSVAKFLQRIEQPSLPSANTEEWLPLQEYRGALIAKN